MPEFGHEFIWSPLQEPAKDLVGPTKEGLTNWAKERSDRDECRARMHIAKTMLAESVSITPFSDPRELGKFQKVVDGLNDRLQQLAQKGEAVTIEGRGTLVMGTNPDSPNVDSVTGARFLTRIIKEPDAWVAEEVTLEGRIISQARIFDDKGRKPELSLFFTDEHYKQRNAVVSVSVSEKYPQAARLVFAYLHGSLPKRTKDNY